MLLHTCACQVPDGTWLHDLCTGSSVGRGVQWEVCDEQSSVFMAEMRGEQMGFQSSQVTDEGRTGEYHYNQSSLYSTSV